MAIIIGIDEAGYGPLLGPLVVSAAVFELPRELLAQSLWESLRRSVCKKVTGSIGRIVINDSKKLHNALGKYELLQRGVLACLATVREEPVRTFAQLLLALESDGLNTLNGYPWYDNSGDMPLNVDYDDIVTAAGGLKKDMKANHIKLAGLWTRLYPAGQFNQMIDAVRNKAAVSFQLVSQLIWQGWQKFADQDLQIVIDKQSGRSHYRTVLQKLFPDLHFKVIKEDDHTSSYQLSNSGNSMKIHFLQKGDQRQLPIALASMTSKYIRELLMQKLNSYFKELCPDITPTAGYYKDGRRFLSDLEKYNLNTNQLCRHLLIRQR
ncbi:MAG: hypothetical protein JW860_10985 [Sedimentisphaerales bacterium]|nr:hypothetical protein [Sedimentisphaerales bacterium]